ncbi:MAG: hypothetical protein EFKGCFLK_01201 [Rhodocyclaceae bacterium]|nr:MAG: prepilin-type N-terminal cleavage/methylation domain-containing protein [Rhodocyclaceae bacterium]MBE7424016.1 prepilin-type N-terminal cleavage/methylation domain-containing protein [Zoogloeaceae bacterium]MBV6407634.1 hypothetical protein [Rhodocyclaceae bacterium]MCK6383333.1 prepilin-type N-terminal cleavage/methylation domain-containing protein [Rhodocyclaceae bacterium]CAG0930230.1 hypothetical protein RHDC3_01452 [Rhodocyclaceae bacterium]
MTGGRRSGRQREALYGFSLVELAVALALLSGLLYLLLDRVLTMQEMAEKTEVEETVRSIDHALRLEAASRMARGGGPKRLPLEKENPIKWLQTPPRNYLGEMEKPPGHAVPAFWYFHPGERQLIYRPNRAEHLVVEGGGTRELRFAVRGDGNLPHPRLLPLTAYKWF